MYHVTGQGFGEFGSGAAWLAELGKQAAGAGIDVLTNYANAKIQTTVMGDYQKRLTNLERKKMEAQADVAERYAQQQAALLKAQDQQEHLQSKEMLQTKADVEKQLLEQQYRMLYGDGPGQAPTQQSGPSAQEQAALLMLMQQQQAAPEEEESKKDRRKKALLWGLGGAGAVVAVGGVAAYFLMRD